MPPLVMYSKDMTMQTMCHDADIAVSIRDTGSKSESIPPQSEVHRSPHHSTPCHAQGAAAAT